MTTKIQKLAAEKAALEARLAALTAGAAASPAVVSAAFLIPEDLAADGVRVVLDATDDAGRSAGFVSKLTEWVRRLPASMQGSPIPEIEAERLAAACEVAYWKAYEPLTDAIRAEKGPSVRARKSKARKMFVCAPLLPEAFKAGLPGNNNKVAAFCTVLQDNAFNVSKALAEYTAAKAPETDAEKVAKIATKIKAILDMTGELPALKAEFKADLVALCDTHGIGLGEVGDTYRRRKV
jgi:hypothetical protein